MILTNKNQKKIVQFISQKMKESIANCEYTELSNTFVPFYDSILDEEHKSNLAEIQMTQQCASKVKSQGFKTFYKKKDANRDPAPLI